MKAFFDAPTVTMNIYSDASNSYSFPASQDFGLPAFLTLVPLNIVQVESMRVLTVSLSFFPYIN
jgi:hypothetical protein